MSKQYLQSTHIPTVVFQAQGAAQSEILPDWLNARYVDLHEREIQYTFHTISETDIAEPDSIAFQAYDDSNWWWLICSYNGIVNPAVDMVVGQRLRIPNLYQVQTLLQAAPDGRREDQIGKFATI